MNPNLIPDTVAYVQKTLAQAEGGHDWWHIQRVWQLAKQLAQGQSVDLLVVELAALLHDIADAKFHNGDESLGPAKARAFLSEQGLDAERIEHVAQIIANMSFKGGQPLSDFYSPEMALVQDADRLDAIGAIGIARAFNFGGFKNRPLYDPNEPPKLQMSREEYKKSAGPTINHFYEKLLLLKDKLNTPQAKALAEERHAFMEQFLAQFYREWNNEA